MGEENRLWLVKYWIPEETDVEVYMQGVIPVVARNKYEAIGKAMTVPGMETTIVDPVSIRAEELTLIHEKDRIYDIKIEELSDIVKNSSTD